MNRTAHVALNWNSLQSSNLQGKSQKRLFFIYLFLFGTVKEIVLKQGGQKTVHRTKWPPAFEDVSKGFLKIFISVSFLNSAFTWSIRLCTKWELRGGESGCKFNIVFSQFTCYKILWDMQFSFYCFTETNKGGLFFLCLCLSNPAVTCSSFYFKQLHTVYHCAYYWRYILKSSIFSIRKSRLILTSNKNYIPYFLCI